MRTIAHIFIALLVGIVALLVAFCGTGLMYMAVYYAVAFLQSTEHAAEMYLTAAVSIGSSIEVIVPISVFLLVLNRLHSNEWLPKKVRERMSKISEALTSRF